jgi:hypothetical protein
VSRIHQLIEMGYRRMNAKQLASQDEPVITGELAQAMNAAIDDDSSPKWTRSFQVQDEQPVNDGQRKGKHRKRIDIGVRSSFPRPRNHFSFEAKLLSRKNPLRIYLGKDGLQCFLRGEYATRERDAGMLGYVQSGTEEEWAQSLQKEFRESGALHGVCDDLFGAQHRFEAGPAHTYHSRHVRQTSRDPIDIFHTLLLFH